MQYSDKCNSDECKLSKNTRNKIPISVNLVVTTKCNYRCRFCFGHFKQLDKTPDDSRILEIPGLLAKAGCKKLTLGGGEPFLSPKLLELLKEAKKVGLTTCVVTNANMITKEKMMALSHYLDWIAISVDSFSEYTEIEIGRGNVRHVSHCIKVASWAHDLGINLKVNSVITSLNYSENMMKHILSIKPDRWKVFQLLQIEGENIESTKDLVISEEEFQYCMNNHKSVKNVGIDFVYETIDDMKSSYIMMLPDGRFFSNHAGKYIIGKKTIFEAGVLVALNEVGWDEEKFHRRGGYYRWGVKKHSNVVIVRERVQKIRVKYSTDFNLLSCKDYIPSNKITGDLVD